MSEAASLIMAQSWLQGSQITVKKILLDFAENYSFIVQDAIKGYHWNNNKATLHVIVVYNKKSGILCSKTYCLISNCLNHNTNSVHKSISAVFNIRPKHPNVTQCIYFSDGASSQYKNCKNFVNICHHNSDHGLEVEWIFFATSHVKSPCDGMGSTVKGLTSRPNLLMTSGQVISITYEMLQRCQDDVSDISFFYGSSENINNHVNQFELD